MKRKAHRTVPPIVDILGMNSKADSFGFLLLTLLTLMSLSVSGRTVTRLSGPGWTCDGEPVCVPHTWNAADACDGPGDTVAARNGDSAASTNSYLRKRAVYRRRFALTTVPGRRYFLECDGASVVSEASLNGRRVGRHVGAFTSFAFEVTDAIRNGENDLEIAVDNRLTELTQPMSADFSVYGGLYRGVRLVEKDRHCIDPRYPVRAQADPKTGEVKVDYRVDGDRRTQTLKVDGFELWSPENPRLYKLSVREGTDSEEVTVGFRTMEFREDGFYLNGVRRQLRGVNRHQDIQGKGWALSAQDEETDVRLMKEMGCDALRTAHYPQSQHVYDLCDRLGLICWVEYPNVNRLVFTEAFERGMRAQVEEMVGQLANHPSVAMWGIWNELEFVGSGWKLDAEKTKAMLERTRDLVHALDPTRPVVAATDKPQGRAVNDVTDQLAYNRYPGWYDGRDMRPILDEMFSVDGRKILGMSEYGVGASVCQHGDPSVQVPPAGLWHPEEYQAWRMHDSLRELQAEPRIWGHFVWAMFDFGADRRTEGGCFGLNDKGLVTYDRKTKKDAFYLYQANWTTNEVLHLVGARATSFTNETLTVMGISNLGPVTLRVNGTDCGTARPTSACGVFWEKVPLKPGPNQIELSAGAHVRTAVWTRPFTTTER